MLKSVLLINWGRCTHSLYFFFETQLYFIYTVYIFLKGMDVLEKNVSLTFQEADREGRQFVIEYPRNGFMSVPRSLVSKTNFKVLQDRILPSLALIPAPS